MKKLIAITAILTAILKYNIAVVVTAPQPFTACDINHDTITLYQATTEADKIYLLQSVKPSHKYILVEDRHSIFNSEDNEIILVRG